MKTERIYVTCARCHGTGGPPPIWDEDTQRSYARICGECSGRGQHRVWSDRR
jgi:DnaJ-class molecular chaperone